MPGSSGGNKMQKYYSINRATPIQIIRGGASQLPDCLSTVDDLGSALINATKDEINHANSGYFGERHHCGV
jgi:hypothetical protein